MTKFYDTCSLLKMLEKAFEEKFMCSYKTLQEIEHIKTSDRKDQDVKYRARKLARLFDENIEKYSISTVRYEEVKATLLDFGLEETPDSIIVATAFLENQKSGDIVFCSEDVCCKNIARDIFNLHVESTQAQESIYKGYREISGTSEIIIDAMSNMNLSDWNVNEYLIIHNTDDGTTKEMRFDGEKFVALKLPASKFIKAKNSLQRCALDILNNPDITIAAILGGYGSGKTYLSFKMALYNVTEKGIQSKILGVREPYGEGRDCGFLPGSLDEKTDGFFLPLVQQLDGGEFEFENLKMRGVLESNIPYYMKGTTYDNTIIVVDEAEDLSEKQIRLIGTRLGENSKIYLSGDYKQSNINSSENNALIKMCNELKGNEKFACIYLGEDVRSKTSKLFATLFQ